jgi:hypothetical protein
MTPFGLKNDGACYQRAMNSMFHDFIGKFMQVYIDDIVVKFYDEKDHLDHLQQSFERMRNESIEMCLWCLCMSFLRFCCAQNML